MQCCLTHNEIALIDLCVVLFDGTMPAKNA
jgi:hypothetical protein